MPCGLSPSNSGAIWLTRSAMEACCRRVRSTSSSALFCSATIMHSSYSQATLILFISKSSRLPTRSAWPFGPFTFGAPGAAIHDHLVGSRRAFQGDQRADWELMVVHPLGQPAHEASFVDRPARKASAPATIHQIDRGDAAVAHAEKAAGAPAQREGAIAPVGIGQNQAGGRHHGGHFAGQAALAPLVIQFPFQLKHFHAEQRALIGQGLIAQQGRERLHFGRFQAAQEPHLFTSLADTVEALVLAQRIVQAQHAQGGAHIGVQVQLGEQLGCRLGLALHLDQRLGDVKVADVNDGQQVLEEPTAAHFHKGFVAVALFQGIEHGLLDLGAIESVISSADNREVSCTIRSPFTWFRRWGVAKPAANSRSFSLDPSDTLITSNAPCSGFCPGRTSSTLPTANSRAGKTRVWPTW